MDRATVTDFISEIRGLVSDGKTGLMLVLIAALAGVTVLGALHDINSNAVTAIYSGIIGAAVGHVNGLTTGRLRAENERLKAAGSDASKVRKR